MRNQAQKTTIGGGGVYKRAKISSDSLEQVITKRIVLGEWSKHFTAFVWTYTLIQGASKVSEWLYICLTI